MKPRKVGRCWKSSGWGSGTPPIQCHGWDFTPHRLFRKAHVLLLHPILKNVICLLIAQPAPDKADGGSPVWPDWPWVEEAFSPEPTVCHPCGFFLPALPVWELPMVPACSPGTGWLGCSSSRLQSHRPRFCGYLEPTVQWEQMYGCPAWWQVFHLFYLDYHFSNLY